MSETIKVKVVQKPELGAVRHGYRLHADPHLTLGADLFRVAPSSPHDDETFETKFYEDVLRQDPCFEDVLLLLGNAYTRRGDYEKGLEIDRRLARLRPSDALVYYNMACSCSLLHRLDDAFAALDRAVELGYRDTRYILKDPDLDNVRKDPRFVRLMTRVKGSTGPNS